MSRVFQVGLILKDRVLFCKYECLPVLSVCLMNTDTGSPKNFEFSITRLTEGCELPCACRETEAKGGCVTCKVVLAGRQAVSRAPFQKQRDGENFGMCIQVV